MYELVIGAVERPAPVLVPNRMLAVLPLGPALHTHLLEGGVLFLRYASKSRRRYAVKLSCYRDGCETFLVRWYVERQGGHSSSSSHNNDNGIQARYSSSLVDMRRLLLLTYAKMKLLSFMFHALVAPVCAQYIVRKR